MLNDLDALTIVGTKLTAESALMEYHVFAGCVLEMAQKNSDIVLTKLATDLSQLLTIHVPDEQQRFREAYEARVFFKLQSKAIQRKVDEILSGLEQLQKLNQLSSELKIIKYPSQKELGDWWCYFEKKNENRYSICLKNYIYSYEAYRNLSSTEAIEEITLLKLLEPIMKNCKKKNTHQEFSDWRGSDDTMIYTDTNNGCRIHMIFHDHDRTPTQYGLEILCYFYDKDSASKFWNKIKAARAENLFVPRNIFF